MTRPRIAVSPNDSMSDTRYGCASERRSGADAPALGSWSDDERRETQWERLARGLPEVFRGNAFYRHKLTAAGFAGDLGITADSWRSIPFTTKAELSQDQATHPPYGTNLTYP